MPYKTKEEKNAQSRRWRAANRDKEKNYRAKWYANKRRDDPEYFLQRSRHRRESGLSRKHFLMNRYKLSTEDWRRILENQQFSCPVCVQPLDENLKTGALRLVVDHDHHCCAGLHSCGTCVRGILHWGCNIEVGYAERSTHQNVLNYLAHYDKPGVVGVV